MPSKLDYIPELYTSRPVEARIVDESTGDPVSEAVVVALWREVDAYNGLWTGIFRMFEVMSDAEGRFTIPRWGPRPSTAMHFIDKRGPEIWVLRRGYLLGFFDNTGQKFPAAPIESNSEVLAMATLSPSKMHEERLSHYARAPDAGSAWHGKILTLHAARTDEEMASSLAGANPLDTGRTHENAAAALPLFWAEWNKCKEGLPARLQREIPFPPFHLTDYLLTDARSAAKWREKVGDNGRRLIVVDENVPTP